MKSLSALLLLLLYFLSAPLQATEPSWQHQLDGPVSGKALVTEQGIYVAAGHTLYQFNDQGQVLNRTGFSHKLYATPVAHQGGLLIHAGDGLHALDFSGNTIWHHASVDGPLKIEGQSWGWGEGLFTDPWAWYRSSVTVDGTRAYYGTANGTYAVSLKDGSRLWHTDTGVTHTTPVLVGNRLVVGSWNNHLYGLDPQTGEQVWQFEGDKQRGYGADWNGWLGFNLDPVTDGKSVYAGNRGGYTYRLRAETGELLWSAKHGNTWVGSPAIIHQEQLYYGLSDGLGLVARKKTNGNITQFVPMPHLIFAAPVAAQNKIYFATLSGEVFELDTGTMEHQRIYQSQASSKNYSQHVKTESGPLYQNPPADLSAHQGAQWQVQQMLQGLDSILSLSVENNHLYLGTATGRLISLPLEQAP
ncbi:PQQ-binding-like beta-propeller repeat protein [Lacimicrobium alkaliphilum]|uniref:Pyrrolo-quinoline quinone repeat domain-containing protein n=1 Tax=Lacimicrobium alkaliphilum TaxID=1526571 RepID=A0A0U2PDC7_9ALTE|nr:PQQ-binding-like beta-propeller repeat protein [Lacimicrobium alkaliphilum]ALS97037.1 hypothetical protein AT746_01240 [Lacimicrobium alkaliphilum]